MARPKYDLVIEAVHRSPKGKIVTLRGYERRGLVFSDRKLWQRADFIRLLQSGRRAVVGVRRKFWGNQFDVSADIRLQAEDGDFVIAAGEKTETQETFDLPRF